MRLEICIEKRGAALRIEERAISGVAEASGKIAVQIAGCRIR